MVLFEMGETGKELQGVIDFGEWGTWVSNFILLIESFVYFIGTDYI